MEEGPEIVSRKEVADRAGVSEATVSRVLNGVGPIKEETKRKVLEAAAELGYHPSAIARSLARGKSGNLGVVLPHMPKVHLFSTYYFSEMLSGIGDKAAERGYDLLLKFRSLDRESDYSTLFQRQKVDGCIILGAKNSREELESLRKFQAGGLPFCLVNQRFDEEPFPEVDADHVQGSYEAVAHLIERGFRRIAFLNGDEQYSNSRDRLLGYRKAMKDAGLPVDESLVLSGNYSRTSGYRAAPLVFGSEPRVEAVFAANDRMAIGLMQGLRELGWTAGRDYAIAGYDDSDAARMSDPPLTTVAVPFFEMGGLAASRVLDRVEAEERSASFREKLPVRLVVRSSSVLK